ncbi:MAG: PilN domain-containing protein [Patescibacteria group bacterium]
MSKKPATININLVPKDPFFHTPLGRAMQWALSAGRYIVIFTELIVIICFGARFVLDQQLHDLNRQIVQKSETIRGYAELEAQFRIAQSKVENIQQIEQDINITDVFATLTQVTPSDVVLNQLSIRPTSITVTGRSFSQSAFNTYITNLQLSPQFFDIRVSRVESGESQSPGINFSIQAQTKEPAQQTRQQTREPAGNQESL